MLKQIINFKDYDGNDDTTEEWFHLSKTEAIDLIDMLPEVTKLSEAVSRPGGLKDSEIKDMLKVIYRVIDMSYGVRSSDGKKFTKNFDVLQEFKNTPAYDDFVFSLLENAGQGLSDFFVAIIPPGLISGDFLENAASTVVELPQPVDDRPDYQKEDRDPTPKEFAQMSPEEVTAAFKWKSDKKAL